MWHFLYFHFFFLKNSWSNRTTMKWKSTSLMDIDSKLVIKLSKDEVVTKLSKDEGKLMKSTMYMSSSSISTSMEHNWSASTFTMLMWTSKSSPFCILMVKNHKVFPKHFWHFRNIKYVQVVHLQNVHKVMQMPWLPFHYNPPFHLHH